MADELDDLWYRIRRHADRFGHGQWRIPDDPVDLAWERTNDHRIDTARREPIERLTACPLCVFENLVRKGPTRVALDRRRVGELPEDPASHGGSSETVARTFAPLPPTLTTAERAAVEAAQVHGSHAAAAEACGMSPRDFRTRLRRAIAKLRAQID